MIKWRKFIFDIANGYYSGIPHCCVWFFSNWCQNNPGKPCASTLEEERGYSNYVSYVQCPHCFEKNKTVEIKQNGGILFKMMGWPG